MRTIQRPTAGSLATDFTPGDESQAAQAIARLTETHPHILGLEPSCFFDAKGLAKTAADLSDFGPSRAPASPGVFLPVSHSLSGLQPFDAFSPRPQETNDDPGDGRQPMLVIEREGEPQMTTGPTILVVLPDATDRETIGAFLRREGFDVCMSGTGLEALSGCHCEPSVVLLDAAMPDVPGIDVCRRLRAVSSVPIIMVTASDGRHDPALALDVGADDCVTKPVRLRELVARVRATLRRAPDRQSKIPRPPVVEVGNVRLDASRHQVTVGDRNLELPAKEFSLLDILLCNQGQVLRRETIMDEVWGPRWTGGSKTLDAHISRLRQRLEDAGAEATVTTIRGLGYRYEMTAPNGLPGRIELTLVCDDPEAGKVVVLDIEPEEGEAIIRLDLEPQDQLGVL